MAGKLTVGSAVGLNGYARVGSSVGTSFGTLTPEPFTGFTVDLLFTSLNADSDILGLVGNTIATFTDTTILINGVAWTVTQPGTFSAGATQYAITASGSEFSAGGVHSVARAGSTDLPADYLLRVTPDTYEGPALSTALPAAVGGKRTISSSRHEVALTNPVYMAARIATISGVWWPFASFSTAAPSTYTGASSGIAASQYLSNNFTGFMEDETLGNRSSPTGRVATPGEIVVIEAWKDVGTGHWRVSVNNTESTAIEVSTTPVNYSWLAFNLYEISGPVFDLYDTVVYNRVPTTTERNNIRASMAAAPPVITSPSIFYVKEGQPIRAFVTASKPRASLEVTGGADYAKITTAGTELIWENGLPRDYDSPDDANTNGTYEIEVTWTDLDGLTATQNISIVLQRQAEFEPVFPYGHLESDKIDFLGEDNFAQTLINEGFFPAAAPPSAVTGTLAATEASTPDAASFAGTVVAPGVSGSLAATEASTPDTASLSGTVAWPARTGSLSATESATADTAALTAQAIATAALAATELSAPDTSNIVGTVALSTTLAATESATPDAAAFSGTVVTPGITGTLSATESADPDVAALSGTVVWPTRTGTLAATESATADTAALSGTVAWTGIFGTLAAAEPITADSAAIVGQLPIAASFSAQETGEDALAASGSVSDPGRIATLAATESATPDAAAFQILAQIIGSLSASETGNDAASFTGTNRVQGSLNATDSGSDTAAATGTVAWATRIATLAAVESSSEDSAALSGTVALTASLAASESGSDTAAMQGLVNYTGIAGALNATESATPDTAGGFTGTVRISAVINAQETTNDTSNIVGSVAILAALAAIEVASLDSAAIVGSVYYTGITGSLAASESATPDAASFAAYVAINGYAHVSESTDPDTALIIGESTLTSTMVLDAIESSAPDQASIFAEAQVTAILAAQEIGEDHFFAGVIRATTFSLPQPRHTSSLGQNRHTESVNEPRETASEPQIRATASLPQDRHTVSLPQPRESP